MKATISILAALIAATSTVRAQADYSALQVPRQIQYQGRVATTAGDSWSGTQAYFCFAIAEGSTTLWNNWQGSSSPSDPESVTLGAGKMLPLPVDRGVFSVRLGTGASTNSLIPPGVFMNSTTNTVRSGVKLAVWFSPDGTSFTRLSPDVDFTSVPYAMVAGIAEAVKEGAVTQNMIAAGSVTPDKLAAAATIPSGTVVAFAGATAPAGWVLCDGLSRNGTLPENAALFAALGLTYGGSGNNFQVPDLRGRVAAGRDNMGGGAANRLTSAGAGINGASLGASGGAQTHTLTVAQMPSHSHGVNDPGHAHSFTYNGALPSTNGDNANPDLCDDAVQSGTTSNNVTNISIQSTGSGQAHNIVQPSLVLNYIIKL